MSENINKIRSGPVAENARTIFYALLIALLIRAFLFQPFNIPSGSMIPTLLVGDYLFVAKYSYGYSKHSLPFSPPIFDGRILARQPHRGDVVVFKVPTDNRTDFIKRLIGLPGDVSYTTLDLIDDSEYDNTGVYTVPPGHYFMMGDNRDNSNDSRVQSVVGYVPFENLVGNAKLIFFSTDGSARFWEVWRWPSAIRWHRLFTWVQ